MIISALVASFLHDTKYSTFRLLTDQVSGESFYKLINYISLKKVERESRLWVLVFLHNIMTERICMGGCLRNQLLDEANRLGHEARVGQLIVGSVTSEAQRNADRSEALFKAMQEINRSGRCNERGSCNLHVQVDA